MLNCLVTPGVCGAARRATAPVRDDPLGAPIRLLHHVRGFGGELAHLNAGTGHAA